jgi:hypothetical protein
MMRFFRLMTVLSLGAGLGACGDMLTVEDPDRADRDRIFARPADVEGFASGQFQQIMLGTTDSLARVHTGMLTAAFENASGLANNGLGPRSNIPRSSIGNERGNAYQNENFADFRILSITARNAATVLQRAKAPGFTLGTTVGPDEQRLKAWGHFVHGVALGYLSMVYDSAGVPRPTDGPEDVPPLEGYQAVNTAAIMAFDSALAYATSTTTTMSDLPGGWLSGAGGAATTRAQFVRVIRSFRARMRAGVARNPTERAAVNWALVIADAENGITSDFTVNMNPNASWDYEWLASTLHYRDANWHQMTYYIIGMADTSRAFDAWLAQSRDSRTPFLIQTPDLRFPQGATRLAQQEPCPANNLNCALTRTRQYFRNRPPGQDQGSSGWRTSFYDHYRWRAFSDAGRIGLFPIFTVAENDLLAAEGYLWLGGANVQNAVPLINKTRTTAGLDPIGAITSKDDVVPGGGRCVPRVPVGPTFTTTACGSIFEAMKWEKRMEIAYTSYGAWYFDSRGWGDLAAGTALSWPVPFQELDARLKLIYDRGGIGQAGAAPVGTYGYGTGER